MNKTKTNNVVAVLSVAISSLIVLFSTLIVALFGAVVMAVISAVQLGITHSIPMLTAAVVPALCLLLWATWVIGSKTDKRLRAVKKYSLRFQDPVVVDAINDHNGKKIKLRLVWVSDDEAGLIKSSLCGIPDGYAGPACTVNYVTQERRVHEDGSADEWEWHLTTIAAYTMYQGDLDRFNKDNTVEIYDCLADSHFVTAVCDASSVA